MRARAPLAAALLLAGAAEAADLDGLAAAFDAVETHRERIELGAYALPVGRFTEKLHPVRRLEGAVTELVLRVDEAGLTTLEALREIEARLRAEGYSRLFDCAASDCGGFDFRFNTRVVDPPAMEVALADFHFLAARRADAGAEDHVGVLASRVGSKLFLQVIAVETLREPAERAAPADLAGTIARRLRETGRSVLDDVDFVSGQATLSEGSDPTLEALADVMRADGSLAIAIVGHSDNVGDAALNQSLSEARAAAVVERLVTRFGAPAARLSAHGVGFLAPAASNATEDGRRANRRVEAVVK